MLMRFDWFELFLSLDGRIGRKAFWIGFSLVAAGLFLTDLLARGVGPIWLASLALLYPLVAILVKRLHDRGRSGWWAAVVAAPFGVSVVAGVVARVAGLGTLGIERVATTSFLVGLAAIAALVIVELGLRRGDPGYSEHGPPPLA